jgi:DnaJ-domain-containing protein 1
MQDAFRETQQKLAGAVGQMIYELLSNLLKGGMDDPVIKLMLDSLKMGDIHHNGVSFDPYRVLGLDKTATDHEIKRRYRELMRKLHPDTAGVKGTEFLVQVVNTAYAQISKERGWH